MKKIILILLITAISYVAFCNELSNFQNCELITINSNISNQYIVESDVFLSNLSQFDMASRMKTSEIVTLNDFKSHLSLQVLDWTPNEIEKIKKIETSIKAKIKLKKFIVPNVIKLIKTTGAEEGNAAYCRHHDVIVLPIQTLGEDQDKLENTIIHELFHIFSRNNNLIQEQLYNYIGFFKTDELELPQEIGKLRITNPDAVKNDYVFKTEYNGNVFYLMPILLARRNYDISIGGEFFDYLTLNFFAVENNTEKSILYKRDGKYLVLPINKITNFYSFVGNNTNYIIHPEEIWADNFVLLINKSNQIKTPKMITELNRILNE